MKLRKIVNGLTGIVASFAVVAFFGGASANALAVPNVPLTDIVTTQNIVHERFQATGIATSFVNTITNPPQIGQGFILEEDLYNPSNVKIGTDHIDCKVVAFTTTTLQFACTASFDFLAGGSLKGAVTFSSDQVNYDALIFSGKGIYKGAVGLIHVTDHGPGNPTGYDFDFYHF